MTPTNLLQAVGESLYGPRWQSEVGRALGITEGMVRKYLRGESSIPAPSWAVLAALLAKRRTSLAGLAKAVQRASEGRA